jgi:hypothetical protein
MKAQLRRLRYQYISVLTLGLICCAAIMPIAGVASGWLAWFAFALVVRSGARKRIDEIFDGWE